MKFQQKYQKIKAWWKTRKGTFNLGVILIILYFKLLERVLVVGVRIRRADSLILSIMEMMALFSLVYIGKNAWLYVRDLENKARLIEQSNQSNQTPEEAT
ncbi:MAG TPA: hypothetical protein VI432_00465 [Candidatus Paceibacterota bacterium]